MAGSARVERQVESEVARELVGRLEQLHSAPQVAQRILALTRDPDFSMRDVAQCIEADPALAAKILRTINSSRYGLRRTVTSLRQAASYLGQRSLRLLVLTFGLTESLTRGAAAELCRDYWRRALTIASMAGRLASHCDELPADEAYTAGLLADIGVLGLAQIDSDAMLQLSASLPHGAESVAAERAQFGTGHPALGAGLLERWGLPELLIDAVAGHHEETVSPSPMEAVVRAGDLMANALWMPQSTDVHRAKQLVREEFGIDTDSFIDLALDCRREVTDGAELFGVDVGRPVDCEQLVAEARRRFAEASVEIAMEMDSVAAVLEEPAD